MNRLHPSDCCRRQTVRFVSVAATAAFLFTVAAPSMPSREAPVTQDVSLAHPHWLDALSRCEAQSNSERGAEWSERKRNFTYK